MTVLDDLEAKPKRTILKLGGITVAVIVALTVLANAIGIASIYWSAESAKITAAPRVTQSIYGTENIIAKVALFHDRCTGVVRDLNVFQNNYQRFIADKEAVKTATGLEAQSAKESMSNDISDYTAALNVAQEDAASYNSASAQYTQNPFKSQNLPYRIELPPGAQAAFNYHVNCH
jgi:hypothetical protein